MPLFPSGIPDIDILYLNNLSEGDLTNVSAINKYIYQLYQSDVFWSSRINQRLGAKYLSAKPNYVSLKEWYNFWIKHSYDIIDSTLDLTLEQVYLRRALQKRSEAFAGINLLLPKAVLADDEIYTYFSNLLIKEKSRFNNYVELFRSLLDRIEDVSVFFDKLEGFDKLNKIAFLLVIYDRIDDYQKLSSMYYSADLEEGYCKGLISIHHPDALIEYKKLLQRHSYKIIPSCIRTAIKYNNWDFFEQILQDTPNNNSINWLIKYGKIEQLSLYFPQKKLSTGEQFTILVNAGQVDQALAYAKSKKNKIALGSAIMNKDMLLRTWSKDVLDIVRKNNHDFFIADNILIKDCAVDQAKYLASTLSQNKEHLIFLVLTALFNCNIDIIATLIDGLKDDESNLADLFRYLCYTDFVDVAIYVALIYRQSFGGLPGINQLRDALSKIEFYNVCSPLPKYQDRFSSVNKQVLYIIDELTKGNTKSFFEISLDYYKK